ncbi:Slp family lipoprotein [Neptunicella sp.]|uniref:Slp family lipoprotein n=1 Tax=Neptunicella sp. TaxID=2125986 RepID=UPI003F68C27E
MYKKITLLFAVMILASCASVPDSLKVAEGQQLVTYPQVMANPQGNVGQNARWGGVIANVENKADSTVVEIVGHELKSNGRPAPSDQSMGRFRVYVDSFLDPMIYQTGRSITFVGQVRGTESGLVGEHPYTYPALHASSYYMWDVRSQVDVTSVSMSMWPGSYWGGWYGWGYRSMWPVHQRVIIRDNDKPAVSGMGPQPTRVRTNTNPRIDPPKGLGSSQHHADRRVRE